jgi:FdhD protein
MDWHPTRDEPDIAPMDFSWPIQRVRADSVEQTDDRVVVEEPLEIVVNDQPIAVLMRMPGHEKELAAGFCISEGYVRHIRDVLLIHHCGMGLPSPDDLDQDPAVSRNRVQVRVAAEGFSPPGHPEVVRLIRSGCGAAEVSALSEVLPRVTQPCAVSPSVLLELSQAMRTQQNVHNQVGGTHSAALFDVAGRVKVVCEDIGRHNAVDKAIGSCLLRDISLYDRVLVTSGRASYEMVVKAIRVGIPVVATISAPTSLAVQLAESQGLTLIGYLRGGRMNVYTHAERIDLS